MTNTAFNSFRLTKDNYSMDSLQLKDEHVSLSLSNQLNEEQDLNNDTMKNDSNELILSQLSTITSQQLAFFDNDKDTQTEIIQVRLDYFNETKDKIAFSIQQNIDIKNKKSEFEGNTRKMEFYYPFLNKEWDKNYRLINFNVPEIMKMEFSYFNQVNNNILNSDSNNSIILNDGLSSIQFRLTDSQDSLSSLSNKESSDDNLESYPKLIFKSSIGDKSSMLDNNSDLYKVFERSVELESKSSTNRLDEFILYQNEKEQERNSKLEFHDNFSLTSNDEEYNIFERNIETSPIITSPIISLNGIVDSVLNRESIHEEIILKDIKNIQSPRHTVVINEEDFNSPHLSFDLPKIDVEPFKPFEEEHTFDKQRNSQDDSLKLTMSYDLTEGYATTDFSIPLKFQRYNGLSKGENNTGLSTRNKTDRISNQNHTKFHSLKHKFQSRLFSFKLFKKNKVGNIHEI
ncbi:hypothetical protein K502DRAFT_339562 [Neoconidiobolus thromboides FSU 785]|nr:hypothetical protein K502DRAFT_339562 [Neoconidiobolus thromboides FSU 785]